MRHLIPLVLLLCGSCAQTTTQRKGLPPLQTVNKVELPKYLGRWYEIASFPQSFQKGCTGTTAQYTLREDGDVDVLNRCFLESLDGREKEAHGRAHVVDKATNAKLEVTFFRPFYGDYWVIDLGGDYEFAVVGHPSRDYLWILSRTPTLERPVYDGIVKRLQEQGYETQRLNVTPQRAAPISQADEQGAGLSMFPLFVHSP